ncbi:hypothetical protein GCM10023340_08280 [Nocardioides marinquilinus]|uniref:Uncharacterized protein n=1 Tax=Nocardioides marinquilinus TaxID=1210400 RepID=A0ABP9PB38_9ACTN
MSADTTTDPDAVDVVPAAITRADQAAWEAPPLRPTFVDYDGRAPQVMPCPDWCAQKDSTHRAGLLAEGGRLHRGHFLRVMTTIANGYYDDAFPEEGEGEADEGVRAAHLRVALVCGWRDSTPRIRIEKLEGKRDERGNSVPTVTQCATLYADEARELIAVLQHLLKVGLD